MQDILIIGTGIIGSFLEHDLSKYNLKITIVDKEADVSNATTMANSAIVHTGYDPKEGTLKAKLNVKGARMYEQICKDLDVAYLKCGAYVVSKNPEEELILDKLLKQALDRGIKANILEASEIRKSETNLSSKVTKGLYVPDTAVIYPWEVSYRLMEYAILNDVNLLLNEEVLSIEKQEDCFKVVTTKQEILTKIVINAAGVYADVVHSMIEESPYKITARKGEYFVLSKSAKGFVNSIIYPTPSKVGKGVLAVPTTHGNTLIGPNSLETKKSDLATTKEGLDFIYEKINDIVENVPYHEIIRSYAGLRASTESKDFYINTSKLSDSFISVACIDSPGLASAPAISRYVIDEFVSKVISLEEKNVLKDLEKAINLMHLKFEDRQKLIEENPLYGKIVCKCENISHMEIVNAIHSTLGAKTIKAIKKKIRPGMGRCQGGFCEIEVAKIIAKELDIKLEDVLYDGDLTKIGSEVK